MKKIFTLLLCAAMILGAVSCGDADYKGDEEKTDSEDNNKEDNAKTGYSKYLDENGFIKGVKASDIVTLPDYKGIEINKSVITVTDEQIQAQVDGLLANNKQYEKITDRAVKDHDKLSIDYVGSIDGKEFEGGSTGGEGTIVEIGVTTYIDDFLYQLIGHKPGETVNVEVTFPADYGKPELNGKDALFVTKINYICGDEIPVELNDEFAKENGFDNKDALLKDIEDWLYYQSVNNYVNTLLEGAVCNDVPKSAINFAIQKDMDYIEDYAAQSGMTFDSYIQQLGYTSKDQLIDANMDGFKLNATVYLAFQAIAEKEGLSASDEDIKAMGITDEDIKEIGLPYFKQYVLMYRTVPDFIIQHANIIDDMEYNG